MADASGMPAKLTVETAIKAYEDGYRIIADWFNKAFAAWNIDVQIEADPPRPGVTLDDCRLRLSNALWGYREYSPKLGSDDELIPWSVGFLRTESDKPGDKVGGIGLQKNCHSPWGSAERVENNVGRKHGYGWKDAQWRTYVVEPMEENAGLWRGWLAGQTGSKSQARTHSNEVLLCVESWERLAIGIDEDGSYLAISPVPELGSVFPKEKATLLTLTGNRWKELLDSLAHSEDGHTVSKKDLFYAFGYLSERAKSEDIDDLLANEGAVLEIKTVHGRLSRTVADLSYELRRVVEAGNDSRKRPPLSASENSVVVAKFICRHLLRDEAGKLRFNTVLGQ